MAEVAAATGYKPTGLVPSSWVLVCPSVTWLTYISSAGNVRNHGNDAKKGNDNNHRNNGNLHKIEGNHSNINL